MDSLEVNKACAAVLVAGIAFFLTGTLGVVLVRNTYPTQPAVNIDLSSIAGAGEAVAKPEPLPPIAPLLAKADPAAGEAITKKFCTSCHTFTQGGPAGVGPNLFGVVGAPHGHMAGFNYSAGLKAKDGPWTYEELNEWLHKPSSYVKGTRMAFAGLNSAQDRANVIDYLRTLAANPEPLPPADAPAAAPPPAQATPPAAAAPPPAAQAAPPAAEPAK